MILNFMYLVNNNNNHLIYILFIFSFHSIMCMELKEQINNNQLIVFSFASTFSWNRTHILNTIKSYLSFF